MKIDENQWKSMKSDEKRMEICEKAMKIDGNRRKSM